MASAPIGCCPGWGSEDRTSCASCCSSDQCFGVSRLNNCASVRPTGDAKAVAFAMPYEAVQSNAFFGRAVPMYGGSGKVETAAFDAEVQAVGGTRE